MARDLRVTPPTVEIHREAREPEWDPTLGITVNIVNGQVDEPPNRLVAIGDSLTHGFMSGAIFRTDLSWSAIVAHELGLLPGTSFRYPVYEPPSGPGGAPIDLERAARAFESRFGPTLEWHEIISALRWVRRYLDGIEDWWERDAGVHPEQPDGVLHTLAVYGWDVLDVMNTTADTVADDLRAKPAKDNLIRQVVENDTARAARPVVAPCRTPAGAAGTVLDGARALGDEGRAGGEGIETLVVMLGSNHALGACLHLEPQWTPDDYLDLTVAERLEQKGNWNVWQPEHFAHEWAALVDELKTIKARHVIVATVPSVTVAPITRGTQGKQALRSRYFAYYTRPWIDERDFEPSKDPHMTGDEARAIDSAIDAYNATIIESVRAARKAGLDWYLLDVGGVLERLASRRYLTDPSAQPSWWRGPYPLPDEIAHLSPTPDTRYFRAGPEGRAEGGLFSLDGVHPTTIGYGIVANEVISIMRDRAGVEFPARNKGLGVDFERLLAADTLISRPPACISGTLSLLGWLDEAVDWVRALVP